MKSDSAEPKLSRSRSRILYQITALVVGVFIVAGIASFFLINSSYDRLIDKSIEKLVQSEAEIISSSFYYVAELQADTLLEAFTSYDIQDLYAAVREKRLSEFQKDMVESINEMVESGLMGLDNMVIMTMGSENMPEPMIIVANDESLVYAEIPPYILEAIDDGQDYIWREEGIPELGLEGEYLVTLFEFKLPTSDRSIYLAGTRSMSEEAADIKAFYDNEKKNITLVLVLVIAGGIIFVVLITFFVLRMLIRRNITDPVDELAAAAAEVNQGNLDVDVKVHEGGDFEGLETAFKEMVENWREYIGKATGGE